MASHRTAPHRLDRWDCGMTDAALPLSLLMAPMLILMPMPMPMVMLMLAIG
jgi:hypothetical protein